MSNHQEEFSDNYFNLAVIGMSGRFPGAKNIDEYWYNLKNGIESVSYFTDEELKESGINHDLLNNSHYIKAKGIIDDIEYFDAPLFDYKPGEATIMDPQIRIFHECAWEALEDAGYNPETFDGPIGLYAGAAMNYFWVCNFFNKSKKDYVARFLNESYINRDYMPKLISYKLGMNGPSVFVQTKCSTSLVSIILAGQSLLNGECDIALAGGIKIALPLKQGYIYQEGMINSSDGHTRAFDQDSDGSIPSDGAGIVVLKRLGDALADGDNIYAVIRGSAMNNDGNRKAGFTAPSIDGQANLIKIAHQVAEVEPESISYIETHGTATALGDPIEIEALKLAFETDKKGYCAIGSVKSNLGHTGTAAGIAGFIKTVLALKHKMIPPSLHFNKPNPKIDFDNSPFFVNTTLTEWKNDTYPLRAGVSSFGVGGTNAHIILEEAPVVDDAPATRDNHLILLSAKTETSLTNGIAKLKDYLMHNQDVNLADLSYTLQLGRKELEHRKAVVCSTVREAVEKLTAQDSRTQAVVNNEQTPQVLFMFPGQGSHYPGMAKKLYETEPVFKDTVDTCYTILSQIHPQVVYHKMFEAGFNIELLDDEQIAAISIFIIEYSLAQLLMELGIKPYAMIGDTIGEYTAACLAGVFSLEDALKLVSTCTNPDAFNAVATTIDYNAPTIAYVSNVDGNWTDIDAVRSSDYWIQQLTNGNNLEQGLQTLSDLENPLFIEVGPGNTISTLLNTDNQKNYRALSMFTHDQTAPDDAAQFLNTLGALWINGVTINWNIYYQNEKRCRISLPTYCFDRKRYWLEENDDETPIAKTTKNDMSKKPDITEWFYVPSWKRSVLNDHMTKETVSDFTWLVLTDDLGVGSQLIAELKKEGATVLGAAPGSQFSGTDDGMYTLNAMNHDEYITLFNDMDTSKPLKIIHLWGLTKDGHDETDPEYVKSLQPLIFHSLINLTRALGTANINNSVEILVGTNGLHQVTGEETLHPGKATVLGPVNVIPQEYPNIACRNCDFSINPQKDIQRIALQLLHEALSGAQDKVLAYRGMYRWVQVFEPHRLEKSETIPHRLKDNGVYLITGGLGTLGLTLAECIAENVKATLILLGRSDFPDKTFWNDPSLIMDESNPVNNKILRLRKIMESGSDVVVVKGDVADYDRMKEIITNSESTYGTINGVIHAAGVIDETVFKATVDITDDICSKQFNSKVYGPLVLRKLLHDKRYDFMMNLSSIASILGGLGHLAYSAVNNFMDHLAQLHNSNGTPQWLSVNWDSWEITLPEGSHELSIKTHEGTEAFKRILAQNEAGRIIVSTGDLTNRINTWINVNYSTGKASVQEPGTTINLNAISRTKFEKGLAEILQNYLGIEQVGTQDSFFELGATSLDIMQVNEMIKKEFNITISVVDMFTFPTISGISKHLFSDVELKEDVQEKKQTRSRVKKAGKETLMRKRNKKRK